MIDPTPRGGCICVVQCHGGCSVQTRGHGVRSKPSELVQWRPGRSALHRRRRRHRGARSGDPPGGAARGDDRRGLGGTDDHTWVWLPERRTICCGDFLIWNFPNAGKPQKVQRYPEEWAAAVRSMTALRPELLVSADGLPIGGAERIARVLGDSPRPVEPHRVGPRRVEPHRVEPHRVGPHRVGPRPVGFRQGQVPVRSASARVRSPSGRSAPAAGRSSCRRRCSGSPTGRAARSADRSDRAPRR